MAVLEVYAPQTHTFRISVSEVPSARSRDDEHKNFRTEMHALATSREVNIFNLRNTENNCYDTFTLFSLNSLRQKHPHTAAAIVSSDARAPYTGKPIMFSFKNFHTQAILCSESSALQIQTLAHTVSAHTAPSDNFPTRKTTEN